jgi:prevent-host-death family protein
MKIASIAEVKANLSAYVKASEVELVVITRNGKPVAVLLPMEDDEELERLALAYSKRFQAILTEGRHQIAATGGISHADFWQAMGREDASSETSPVADSHRKQRPNHGLVCPEKSSSADRCKSGRGHCQEAT